MSALPDLRADFLALERLVEAEPEGTNAEIVRGVYLFSPRPRVRHLTAQGRLHACLLLGPGQGSPGESPDWLFLQEPELRSELTFSRLIPDLAGWRRSTGGWPGPDESLISLVPDWVAEVLSPASADLDRGRKRETYGLMGVAHYWLVDPDRRTVEIFTNVRGALLPETSLASDDPLSAPPFGDLRTSVASLFPG